MTIFIISSIRIRFQYRHKGTLGDFLFQPVADLDFIEIPIKTGDEPRFWWSGKFQGSTGRELSLIFIDKVCRIIY